jgi:hypothetical protein
VIPIVIPLVTVESHRMPFIRLCFPLNPGLNGIPMEVSVVLSAFRQLHLPMEYGFLRILQERMQLQGVVMGMTLKDMRSSTLTSREH